MLHIKNFVFNPVAENTYVLSDESKEAAIIDCGCFTEVEWKEVKHYIEDEQLRPVLLINTHLHFDHSMGNHFAFKDYGLETYASEADFPLRDQLMEQTKMFLGRTASKYMNEHEVLYPLAKPLSDGDMLGFGQTSFKVIATPGHTPGGLCFYFPDDKVLFSGDTLFKGSVGRTDLPGGSYRLLVEAITSKLLSLPSETIVYPGHGAETSIGYEMEFNPYI